MKQLQVQNLFKAGMVYKKTKTAIEWQSLMSVINNCLTRLDVYSIDILTHPWPVLFAKANTTASNSQQVKEASWAYIKKEKQA